MKIAQIKPLRVKIILPLAMHGRIQPGTRLEITPELAAGVRLWASVTRVDKVLDAASGTFQVQLDLPNPDGTLPSGLRCRAGVPAP